LEHIRKLFLKCKSNTTIDFTGNPLSIEEAINLAKTVNATIKIIGKFPDNLSYQNALQLVKPIKFTSNRFAVVIGNANYSVNPLPSSSVSGSKIVEVLKKNFNFNIWKNSECEFKNRSEWNEALKWLSENLMKCSEALFILFFCWTWRFNHSNTLYNWYTIWRNYSPHIFI